MTQWDAGMRYPRDPDRTRKKRRHYMRAERCVPRWWFQAALATAGIEFIFLIVWSVYHG